MIPKLLSVKEKIKVPKSKNNNEALIITGAFLKVEIGLNIKAFIEIISNSIFSVEVTKVNKPL